MRYLLLPRIKITDGTDSFTLDPMNLIKYFSEFDPNAYFYLCVHEKHCEDTSWILNYGITVEQAKKICFVPMEHCYLGSVNRCGRRASYGYLSALAAKIGPKDRYGQYLDVVISESLVGVEILRAKIEGLWQKGYTYRVPFIGWVHWNPVPSWYTSYYNEFDAYSELVGGLFCDGLVFGSLRQQDDFFTEYTKFFNASTLEHLQNKSIASNLGVEVEKIKRKKEFSALPTVLWSGYASEDLSSVKKPLIKLAGLGKIKVIFQFIDKDLPKDAEEVRGHKNVKVEGRIAPYGKYLEFLNKADIFVALSQNIKRLTYGRRWGEMIAAGLLPIVSRDIAATFLPEEYPFVLSPRGDLEELLRAALMCKKAQKKSLLDEVYAHLVEHHFIRKTLRQFYGFVCSKVAEARKGVDYGVLEESFVEGLGGRAKITHSEAVEAVGQCMQSPLGIAKHSMYSSRYIRASILHQGYCDIGGQEPIYVRAEA